MTAPVRVDSSEIIESVLVKGDLAKLSPDERTRYYIETCKSLNLNPLTQPFAYITLNGRLTLYAKRDCTDQLRRINSVSLEIISREIVSDILTVHARAKLPDGRTDEDFGSVYFPETLRGEARANAELKAVTKSKRRVTLSICGLGWLSEEEVSDIPAAARAAPVPAPLKIATPKPVPAHDQETGEVADDDPVRERDDGAGTGEEQISLEDMAREAAMRGEDVFATFYKNRAHGEKIKLNKMGDELRSLMGKTKEQINE